jgi:hypothetical protein
MANGECDRYSYITPGENHDCPLKEHSSEVEKPGKEVEYELAVVEDENVYEDPDELMETTVEGPGICNPMYHVVAPEPCDGEGATEEEEIYSEIKD